MESTGDLAEDVSNAGPAMVADVRPADGGEAEDAVAFEDVDEDEALEARAAFALRGAAKPDEAVEEPLEPAGSVEPTGEPRSADRDELVVEASGDAVRSLEETCSSGPGLE